MASQRTFDVFPGFDKLYVFTEPGNSRAFRASLELRREQPDLLTKGDWRPTEPIIAHWMMGEVVPRDVIWTGNVAPVLVSERFLGELRKIEASGWGTYEIRLTGRNGDVIHGYHGLSVNGRCGPIDDSRSVKGTRMYPAGEFPIWRGLYFDPQSWDGSDFFVPSEKGALIFVTSRIKTIVERMKIRDVKFQSLDSIERSEVEMRLIRRRSLDT